MPAPALVVALLFAAGPPAPLPIPEAQFDLGAVVTPAAPASVQSLRISLQVRDHGGLDALIAAQHTPDSPQYRGWLTPAGFGARFGQPPSAYQALSGALESAGLTVKAFHNRIYLEAEGTVAQVQRLLGIQLVDVAQRGQRFRSFRGSPRLPSELASMVLSVGGLDTRQRYSHRLLANAANTFGPQDLRRFYDIDSLHALGFGGQLSTVAVIGTVPQSAGAVSLSAVQYFYQAVSDSTATPLIDTLPLGSSSPDAELGANIEEEMDMEMPTVAAPLVQSVTLVQAPIDTLFTSGFNEVNENLAGVTSVSSSFGECEASELDGGYDWDTQAVANAVAQGASEGIAYFVSAGDFGSADCDGSFLQEETIPAVDFPASVPYLIGVGGTMYTGAFDGNHAVGAHGSETVWNETFEGIFGPTNVAGGGGASQLFARPWYQTAPGTSTGSMREVPDLALLASVVPGVAIVDTLPGQIDNSGNGTSDASPMAAGMFALINDVIGGCRIGTPGPELYALGTAQYTGGNAVFNDVTSGTNALYGVPGFTAGVGYDEASGLGSIDVAALAAAWRACAPANPNQDAGALVWPGGAALDAGPRVPYSPCAAIHCGAGTTCQTLLEGPAQCAAACDPQAATPCIDGDYCEPTTTTTGLCTQGCPQGLTECFIPCSPGGPKTCGEGYACTPYLDGGYCASGCALDSDCNPGAVCLQSQCQALCDPTVADACGFETCTPLDGGADAGVCTFGACTQDSDCQFSESCIAGTCAFPCDPSVPGTCGTIEYCVAVDAGPAVDAGGSCQLGCGADSDCPTGELCQVCDHSCINTTDAGAIGAACGQQTDCYGTEACLGPSASFPGGMCSQYCSDPCGCGAGASCLTYLGICAPTCSVSHGGPCRAGYACDPQDSTDVGSCLPGCKSSEDCGFYAPAGTCDIGSGACYPPGLTPPPSSSTGATSIASSTGTTGTTGTSSSTSSGGTHASTSTGSSSGGAAGTGTTGSGASTGTVASTSGGGSSAGAKKSGCGCGADSASDPLVGFGLLLVGLARARRARDLVR